MHDPAVNTATQGEGSLTELPTGGYRIAFERRFDRPVSDVWNAISSPDGLDAWFPTTLRHEGVVGTAITETFEGEDGAPPQPGPPGVLSAYDPPHLFEVTIYGPTESQYPGELGTQVLRMRVSAGDAARGTALLFEHEVETRPTAVAVLPGWHWCLESLASHLGASGNATKEYHDRLVDWYRRTYS